VALREDQTILEQQLNTFEPDERRRALGELMAKVHAVEIFVPSSREEVNLHYHTFFSFNANAWSPSRIAWESLKYGLEVSGIVDFDVLDGMEEFLSAGDMLGLKAVVGMETRVFVEELSNKVMSSPNEPGIAYFMASGCFKYPPAGSDSERILRSMAQTARNRNVILIERVNSYLEGVQLEYDRDVVPLTPSDNATERHILAAYDRKAAEILGGGAASFWASKLGWPESEITMLIQDTPRFHELLRSKLMKHGGAGYIPPDSGSFLAIDDAIGMIRGMDALPMIAWLDGTNPGEQNSAAFLELLHSKGVAAINIIPDRNWNIRDLQDKSLKTHKLREIVETARRLHMPIAVGTEMNMAGLPFVDDFAAPELSPYLTDFMEGAWCIYAHTLLARFADFGYLSDAAQAAFGEDIAARNRFFVDVGELNPSPDKLHRLSDLRGSADSAAILNALR
jgi:hypothetical protein